MAAIFRRQVSRVLVILGAVLTVLWGGALAWLALPWLFSGVVEVGGLLLS